MKPVFEDMGKRIKEWSKAQKKSEKTKGIEKKKQ